MRRTILKPAHFVVGVLFIVMALGMMPPAAAGTLPGEPDPPVASDMQHLSTEEVLKTAWDWAKFAKEPGSDFVINATIAAISIGYPPAGFVLGLLKGLIIPGGPDPVDEALKALDARLNGLQERIDNLQQEVSAIRNEQFKQANLARLRWLLDRSDQLKGLTHRLRQKPTDTGEKDNIVYQAQVLVARFRPQNVADLELWRWSDLYVFTDPTTRQVRSEMLVADFKTLPTFEYYVSALVLYMSAIEYAYGHNAELVKSTYGQELLNHAEFLSVRPPWSELDAEDLPQTLPEKVMRRIRCEGRPTSRYPEKRMCYATYDCKDFMRKTITKNVDLAPFSVPSDNTLCTISAPRLRTISAEEQAQRWAEARKYPRYGSQALELWRQWRTPPVTSKNDDLALDYGVEAMAVLADTLVRLAKFGSTREQLIGQFDMTLYNQQFLYAVKPNGELLWYKHVAAVNRNVPKSPEVELVPSMVDPKVLGKATSTIPDARVELNPPKSPEVELVPTTVGSMDVLSPAKVLGNVTSTVHDIRVERVPSMADQAKPPMVIEKRPPGPRLAHQWQGPKLVGSGWQSFREVIPAGLSGIYGLGPDGVLKWYRHDGFVDGTIQWKGPVNVGTGWDSFTKIVAGGDGVLYGIGRDGVLRWYRHGDFAETSTRPTWSGPKQVGIGWGSFVHVFSTGEGVIYGVTPDGQLLWYRHKGFLTGTPEWEGPKQVGTGWTDVKRIFSPGDGAIYALRSSGELMWSQHVDWRDGKPEWEGPSRIAADWGDFVQVFPRIGGMASLPVIK